MKFKRKFNNEWLLESAQPYFEAYHWLESAIKELDWSNVGDPNFIYFVDPWKKNEGYEWQDQERITLEETKKGPVDILVIEENRIGGIEFLEKTFAFYFSDVQDLPDPYLSEWEEKFLPELTKGYPESVWAEQYKKALWYRREVETDQHYERGA